MNKLLVGVLIIGMILFANVMVTPNVSATRNAWDQCCSPDINADNYCYGAAWNGLPMTNGQFHKCMIIALWNMPLD